MSYEKVKGYFENMGLGERVVVRDNIGDTVEHAAIAVGCEPAHIAKTMSFMRNEQPILIVMAGDVKIDNSKYKAKFNQKAVMIKKDEVENLIGHVPGAVCPFVVNEGVEIFLDKSLQPLDVVYSAGGSLNSTVELRKGELDKYIDFVEWVDVCKPVNEENI